MSVDRAAQSDDPENASLEELSRRIKNDEAYSDDVRELAEVILEGIQEGRIDE